MQDFTAFLKLFYPELSQPKDYFWKVDSISQSLNDWISGHLNAYQIDIWQITQEIFLAIYQSIYKGFKEQSVISKNHWLKYVSGESNEKTYGKSGKFSVKRYLQGKKYFYYRSGKTEGDQELEKKMDKDYDDFLKGSTDEEIDRILEVNPKLIYAIKSDILQSLIQ
jgi:hypothetical protein